jgi:hypothetical protein
MIMKLAVVMFGHYRTFDQHVNFWRGVDADFYISTWDTLDSTSKTWHKPASASIPLTTKQIDTLKSFDPHCYIGTQEWDDNETLELFGFMPFKSILYKYECILRCVQRIVDSKIQYDTVLFIRPDIQIKNLNNTLDSSPEEIRIGFAVSSMKYQMGGTDLIYAIHYSDLGKFAAIPETLWEWKNDPKKYTYSEEHFTEYLHRKWKRVLGSCESPHSFIVNRFTP